MKHAICLTEYFMSHLKITFFLAFTVSISLAEASGQRYDYQLGSKTYHFKVRESGINQNFEFLDYSPNEEMDKLSAGLHVMKMIYQDPSIDSQYSHRYIKERARCFVYDSLFYTYTLCFLPNEFSSKNSNRFWGFTTKVPNWLWLITRIAMPAALFFAAFFYFSNRELRQKIKNLLP